MGIFPTRKPDGHHVADTPASEVYLNLNEPDYDAKMRAAWERTMPENLREADDYRHVAVLIAQWADDLDQDLGCAAEVDEPRSRRSNVIATLTMCVGPGVARRIHK